MFWTLGSWVFGYRLQVFGYWVCGLLCFGSWVLGFLGFWVLGFGLCVLDFVFLGFWILVFALLKC